MPQHPSNASQEAEGTRVRPALALQMLAVRHRCAVDSSPRARAMPLTRASNNATSTAAAGPSIAALAHSLVWLTQNSLVENRCRRGAS